MSDLKKNQSLKDRVGHFVMLTLAFLFFLGIVMAIMMSTRYISAATSVERVVLLPDQAQACFVVSNDEGLATDCWSTK